MNCFQFCFNFAFNFNLRRYSMGRTKHGHDPVHSAALGSALMDIIGDFQIPRTVLKARGIIQSKHSADVESTQPSPRVGGVQVETN